MSFYKNRVNGVSYPDEFVTSQFDYISITTSVDIRTATDATGGSATSQGNLDKLVEIISTVAQPVILFAPYAVSTNYVLKVAIEHTGAWTSTSLVSAIVASQYAAAGFTSDNTSVVIASAL